MKKFAAITLTIAMLVLSTTVSGFAYRSTISGTYIVNARTTDVFSIKFYANNPSQITIRGDRSTDLDLYVFDSQGRLVARDTDYDDQCIVYFTPRATDIYTVKVENLGSVWNQYVLTAR